MSTSFERASRFSDGYSIQDVDDFLARARKAYEGGTDDLTSEQISATSFGVQRGGYRMSLVDEALDRLADAFALKERDRAIAEHGEDAWVQELARRADTLRERLERPAGLRFAPGEGSAPSYDMDDVDALCDELIAYFTQGHPMSVDDVRRAAFARRKGEEGYSETVVDVYLDRVASVMASVP